MNAECAGSLVWTQRVKGLQNSYELCDDSPKWASLVRAATSTFRGAQRVTGRSQRRR